MQTAIETRDEINIIDQDGFELSVKYEREKCDGYYAESGNPNTYVEPSVSIDILCVELVICGRGIDITRMLTQKQRQFVESYVKSIDNE